MGQLTIQGMPVWSGFANEPSNKNNSTGQLTICCDPNEPDQCIAPAPFIDRLCITAKLTSEDADLTKAPHFAATTDQSVFKSAKYSKGYKRAYKLALPSVLNSTHWPHYQFTWDEHGISRVRIDLVPVDLGWEGMIDLHSVLVTLLPDGWQFFIKHGNVTRLDVALDFPELAMNDFMILPQQCLTVTRRSNHGQLQTVELGKPKGNQTCIYDRYQKRIAKGQGCHYSQCVRVERRLRAKPFPLASLEKIKNPFAGLQLIAKPLPKPGFEKHQWKWDQFKYTAEAIGLESALATVPEKRRARYRKFLKQLSTSWWDGDASWSQWDKCLSATPVADMKSYI